MLYNTSRVDHLGCNKQFQSNSETVSKH